MLQTSGPIGLKDIALELGHGGKGVNMTIISAAGDKYVKVGDEWVKLCKCSHSQPLYPAPFSIFHWYGYDHSAQGVTGVDIAGKTAVLPFETATYSAIINGPNQIGITLLWEVYDGTSWTQEGFGNSVTVTYGADPSVQKLRLRVLNQCQGGESLREVQITKKGTYYNLISCGVDLGIVRQTHTPIGVVGQVVFWDGGPNVHFWDGTVTDTVTDYIGAVYMGVGTYCGDSHITTYYELKRCSDNALFCTTTKIGVKNQRVVDSANNLYTYTGVTWKSAVHTLVTVSIVHGKIRCNDPIGDPVYYKLTRCSDSAVGYTTTPIAAANTRAFAGVHGIFISTGETTTVLPPGALDLGEVNVTGAFGCSDGGSSGGGIYKVLYRCANGVLYYTTKNIDINGQKFSHGTLGELYWNGNTVNSASSNVIPEGELTPLAGQTGCGSSGSTTYYQLRRCGTNDHYYTATNPGSGGQKVSSGSLGELVYTGATTTSPGAIIGDVTILSGQYGCTSEGGGTLYESEERGDYIRKECEVGVGSLVWVHRAKGAFVSSASVAAANALRDASMQAEANANGTCTGTTECYEPKVPSFYQLEYKGASTYFDGSTAIGYHVFAVNHLDNSMINPRTGTVFGLTAEHEVLGSTGFLIPQPGGGVFYVAAGTTITVRARYYWTPLVGPTICYGPWGSPFNIQYGNMNPVH